MNAPHLPAKTCSIRFRDKVQTLPWVLFVVVISAITAVALSSSVVAWFTPYVFTNHDFIINSGGNAQISGEPNKLLQSRMDQQLLTLIMPESITNSDYLLEKEMIGSAVMISSDGWSVAMINDIENFEEKIVAIDNRGQKYYADKIIEDPATGVKYIHWNGNGFRVVTFSHWNNVDYGMALWKKQDNFWQGQILGIQNKVTEEPTLISPQAFILENTKAGSPIFHPDGTFVGFVDKTQTFVPGWKIENQVASVLGNEIVKEIFVPATGQNIFGYKVGNQYKLSDGFLVDISNHALLLKGDIITHINGKPFDSKKSDFQILSAGDYTSYTLIRNQKEVQISLNTYTKIDG